MNAQPNWYPDPQNPYQLRWWDGTQWTAHTAPKPVPQAPAPAGYVIADKRPVNKAPFIIIGVVITVIVGVIIAMVLGVMNYFGAFTRFSDEEALQLQQDLSSQTSNIDITVYASGTVCEQLCQELYVNLAIPDNSEDYTTEDISNAVGNTLTELEKRNKVKDVQFCFDFVSEDFNSNNNSASYEEQELYDRLENLGFPKADYNKTDEESDLAWTTTDCIELSPEEMKAISQS